MCIRSLQGAPAGRLLAAEIGTALADVAAVMRAGGPGNQRPGGIVRLREAWLTEAALKDSTNSRSRERQDQEIGFSRVRKMSWWSAERRGIPRRAWDATKTPHKRLTRASYFTPMGDRAGLRAFRRSTPLGSGGSPGQKGGKGMTARPAPQNKRTAEL